MSDALLLDTHAWVWYAEGIKGCCHEEAPEGGFIARAVGMDIFTEADYLPALRAQARDAVHCHFEDALYSLDNIAQLISRAWIETLGSGARHQMGGSSLS